VRIRTVGLSPDCGVSALLPEIVGTRRAAMLLLTDTPPDARDALAAGLVTVVYAPEEALARAREIAGGFARRSRTATAETLALLRTARSRSYVEQLRYEADAIARCAATPEARDMLAHFASR
jgi:2-(1,2-epoxy-1,2-dihydrophenyl)acetyl-CoA isomerase